MNPRWRVVIVDDDAESRAALAEAVTGQGGQVVGNGSRVEDAAHLVRLRKPDVALVGADLSDGDGVEAARRVMRDHPCPVVVALPKHSEPDLIAAALDAGVLGFVAKPVREADVPPSLDLAVSRFRDLESVRRENQDLKKKLEARKLVDRAKALLIERLGLSEAEAYRRLQKTAMDTRRTMGDVAQALLGSDERGTLRAAK